MNLLKLLKNKINNWFEDLAESNKEQFGNKGLDCCKINKNENER